MKPEQGVAPYSAQGASRVNADVGATMIIEPINPNDPVVGDTATSRQAPSLLENMWNSQKTEMNSPNKALQVTAHKAPNLNADVRIENMKIRLAADAA